MKLCSRDSLTAALKAERPVTIELPSAAKVRAFIYTYIKFCFQMAQITQFKRSATSSNLHRLLYRGWLMRKDIIGHYDRKVYMNVRLILIGYRDIAVWIYRPNSIRFLFVGLVKGWSLQKKGGYTRETDRSHFGCRCPHKEAWSSTPMRSTRSSHTNCKVHWGWRWDFRKFIVKCNKFYHSCVINLTKLKLK